MKNKLPKKGLSYKNKISGCVVEFSEIEPFFDYLEKNGNDGIFNIEAFWDKFEEVPEIIDKVKVAREELRDNVKNIEGFFYDGGLSLKLFYYLLIKNIENLLDALDEQEKVVCSPKKRRK